MKPKNEKPSASKKESTTEKETKQTTPVKTEVQEPEKKKGIVLHPLNILVEKIGADTVLLRELEEQMRVCKEAKTEVTARLKDYRSDLKVFFKYSTDEQKQDIEDLGIEAPTPSKQTVNPVVQIALNIMQEKKKLTNGELFDEYVNAVPDGQVPENYTFFNIKIRSLFNREILKKTKGNDPKSSRTDVITLNEMKTE